MSLPFPLDGVNDGWEKLKKKLVRLHGEDKRIARTALPCQVRQGTKLSTVVFGRRQSARFRKVDECSEGLVVMIG